MNYFILLIFTLMTSSSQLSAGRVFVSLSIINTLRFTITMVPFVITGVIQVMHANITGNLYVIHEDALYYANSPLFEAVK